MQDTFEKSELDAYYAGVGYGKMKAKDKHLGFNSNEERQVFEHGIENKDKHFKSIRAYRSFWERLFGIGRKERRKDHLKIKNSSQNVKRKRNVITLLFVITARTFLLRSLNLLKKKKAEVKTSAQSELCDAGRNYADINNLCWLSSLPCH